MSTTITVPFSVGETIWHASLIQSHYDFPCPSCKGTGTLKNCDNEDVKCGTCYGSKTKGATKREWYPAKKTIESLYIFVNGLEEVVDSVYFREKDDDGCQDFTQCIEDVFQTKEECEAYCKSQNETGASGVGFY